MELNSREMMPSNLTTAEWYAFEAKLTALGRRTGAEVEWPTEQLADCGKAGVYRWFAPEALGGWEWSDEAQTVGYLQLSRACLATAFIITQRTAAFSRILASENRAAQNRWLPDLVAGKSFATVGISHLTTSRQHIGTPVLRATNIDSDQYVLDGYVPWVTGGAYADCLVIGATMEDGRQILASLDAKLPGISAGPGLSLLGLSASKTDRVEFDRVKINGDDILFGPIEGVMQQGKASGTGGLQTSTLALGLARQAIDFLQSEANNRNELLATTEKLDQDWQGLWLDLISLTRGKPNCLSEELRQHANSLVLRATQSALTAAKGAGYLASHPTARWCREALFFLVWSCPKNVSHANLCEFAGLTGDL